MLADLAGTADFRSLANGLPFFVWTHAADGSIDWVNDARFKITRLRPDVASTPEGWAQVIPREEIDETVRRFSHAMATVTPYEMQHRLKPLGAGDDEYRWIHAHAEPRYDSDGTVIGWVGWGIDIHAVRTLEEAVNLAARTQERYRVLAETLPAFVWTTDPDGRMNYANEGWYAYTGLTAEDAVEKGYADLVHSEDVERVFTTWKQAVETGTEYRDEMRLRRARDGMYRWMHVRGTPLLDPSGRVTGWIGANLDIHNERSADERRETELRSLVETIPQLAWTTAPDGKPEWFNKRWYEYTGLSPDASDPDWDRVRHPEDSPGVQREWETSLRSGEPLETRCRLRGKDNRYRWHLIRAVPSRDEVGKITRWFGTSTDIDAQKRVEEQLMFLTQANEPLVSLPVADALTLVARLAVPRIADWCAFYLKSSSNKLQAVAIEHQDVKRIQRAREMVRLYPPKDGDASWNAMKNRQSLLFPSIPRDLYVASAVDARHLELMDQINAHSVLVIPIVLGDEALGVIHLVREESAPEYNTDDQRFGELLAKRVAVAIDNDRVYQRERHIADTFQQAALPKSLPTLSTHSLKAVYAAAESEAHIGGDWYDAFLLDDGKLALSIGDVGGKGLDAAVTMSTVRQGIRMNAYEGRSPAAVLGAIDAWLQRGSERLVSAFFGIFDFAQNELVYASAGHPPGILRTQSGQLEFLQSGDPPLGLLSEKLSELRKSFDNIDLLVLHTDGITEATRDVLAGEERLASIIASTGIAHSYDPARFIYDSIFTENGIQRSDDVAILTLKLGEAAQWSFMADDAMSAQGARSAFLATLKQRGTDDSDFDGAELIFGELIGNVVKHAPGIIDVCMEWTDSQPVLHVMDRGPGYSLGKAVLPDDPFAEG
ncbi:MAG: PAS domain-containing protein, partial [Candidatus Eremiobacteraeota bacterium]|nr:PAS domain-containing protein [Candidatus Eremiobacteraeota bacterium]